MAATWRSNAPLTASLGAGAARELGPDRPGPFAMSRAGALRAAPGPLRFVEGLRQLGWSEGQNIRIDVRWNAGDAGLAQTYAARLIELKPEVIIAASTTNLAATQQEPRSSHRALWIRRSCRLALIGTDGPIALRWPRKEPRSEGVETGAQWLTVSRISATSSTDRAVVDPVSCRLGA
jgi:hypothetical protein